MRDENKGIISMISLASSVTLTIASNFFSSPIDERMIIIALILAYISIFTRS